MTEHPKEAQLISSVRRLLATVLELAQVRVDLFGTELELEKRRIFDGLLWGAVAVVVLSLGLVLVCGFIILLVSDGYRLLALGVMAFVLLTAGALLLLQARRRLKSTFGLFHLSLAELQHDISDLKPVGANEQR